MKKNGKEAEDARYQGTALRTAGTVGNDDSELQSVPILGGPVASISEWVDQYKSRAKTMSPRSALELDGADAEGATPATSMLSTAPPSPRRMDVDSPKPTP